MAVTVTHPFVSAISDGADATVVRPSNWNADHAITGTLDVANGGTGASTASITSFNNITGYTAAGATGTTSTNLVFSASPTFTGTLGAAAITASTTLGVTGTSTLSGNAIISVTDNTNAALRITQLGTGNALLVEDSTNPDATPFAVLNNGTVMVGHTTNLTSYQIQSVSANPLDMMRWNAATPGATSRFAKSRSATVGTYSIVDNGDTLGTLAFAGDDGTAFIQAASISASVDGTPGTNDMPGRLVFSTTADGASSPTERMRISSSGTVGIGGSGTAGVNLDIRKIITGAVSAFGVNVQATIQSDVTTTTSSFQTFPSTAAAAFTLTSLRHFDADQGTIGVGSTVTNQYGFRANSTITGATNNYGFYGNIASGTNRYNLYMAGTAANYLAGTLTAIGGISGGTF